MNELNKKKAVLGWRVFVYLTVRTVGVMFEERKYFLHTKEIPSEVLTLAHMKNLIDEFNRYNGSDTEINSVRFAKCFMEVV